MKKLLALLVIAGCSQKAAIPTIESMDVGTDVLLQAISIVDDSTVWMSGHKATFIRTTDGGDSWDVFQHPTGDTLQFRDIHAFDKDRVILMSAGPGPLSRIFEVREGKIWRDHFVMQDSLGFLDCLDFWDDQRGVAYGDAIDDYPYILLTNNGGRSWARADTTGMPKAGRGEGGFAASGTCVTIGDDGLAWIATGAGGNARILNSTDYGKSWQSYDSPMVKGDAAGHTSVDFADAQQGFVTGGDLAISNDYTENCAFTSDGGQTWQLTKQPVTKGAFYGGSFISYDEQQFAFACGPNGIDYTADMGKNWSTLDSANLWAVSVHSSGIGWASGRDGKVLKIVIE